MKLKSIEYLLSIAKESFLRFPLTILCSLITALVSILLKENVEDPMLYKDLYRILLTIALGIPLFFCVSILITKYQFSLKFKLLSHITAFLILALIYLSLPNADDTSKPFIRYILFSLIAHLFVSFAPYLKKKNLNGFWNYNKILFIRFFLSLLYSVFLFGGLAVALLALQFLLNIEIYEQLYFYLAIIVFTFFHTWFFVSGVPKDFDALENIRNYPNGLKIFTQYILLPLLILYLLILYAYIAKILVDWDWPKGFVSYMIFGVSLLGIFTLLLIHPYSNLKENLWIKKFTNIFYYILFPLIIILFIAIGYRISEYGITVNRYIIVLLGIWLLIIACYFSLRKTNIKFIPISLAITLALMTFGPWSMFSMSENSQVNRLKRILKENNLLDQNNKLKNEIIWEVDSLPSLYSKKELSNKKRLSYSEYNEIKSILNYLNANHGLSKISPLYKQNIDSLKKASEVGLRYNIYMRTMGVEINDELSSTSYSLFVRYTIDDENIISLKDYDYLFKFDASIAYKSSFSRTFLIDSINYTLVYNQDKKGKLFIKSKNDVVYFKLNPLLKNLEKQFGRNNNYDIDKKYMTLNGVSKSFEIKIEFRTINLKYSRNSTFIRSTEGFVLIKNKK